jgi:hypothetical protein
MGQVGSCNQVMGQRGTSHGTDNTTFWNNKLVSFIIITPLDIDYNLFDPGKLRVSHLPSEDLSASNRTKIKRNKL